MISEAEKQQILLKAKQFFRDKVATNHIKNTEKCEDPSEFNINPFLSAYLAKFLCGDTSSESIARALVYPRVLGTSITTSFGMNLQYFCIFVLAGFASAIPGLDIEFIDQIDNDRKYCQLKSGPRTINKDDVETIFRHFTATRNLARANHLPITESQMVVGVFYGTEAELSNHYENINERYPVFVGQNFWLRLTGDASFYHALIDAVVETVEEVNGTELLEQTIHNLAENLERLEGADN